MIENQFKAQGFVVWFICALFFMYEFMLRTVVGTFQHQLMHDLHLNAFQFSFVSTTVFLITIGVMQIPVGILVENFGLKATMVVASMLCGLSAIAFSYSESFIWAATCRMLMGFGASFGFVCLLMSVNSWMPHAYIAIFIGLSQFIGTLGPIAAAGPLTSLSSSPHVTWQVVFFILGLVGLGISVLVFFFVCNNDHYSGKYIVLSKPEKTLVSLKKLFSRPQPWVLAFTCTAMYFSVEYLSENEGRIFLMLKGKSVQSASNMLTISWIGYALGCPIVGFISDFIHRRKIILTVCSFIALIAMVVVVFAENSILLYIGFLSLGLGAGGINVGFAMIAEHFKQEFVAVGFGLINAILMLVSAVTAPLIGLGLDFLGSGPNLTLGNYTHVFYLLIAIAVIGFILATFFIKETFCKSALDFTYLKYKAPLADTI